MVGGEAQGAVEGQRAGVALLHLEEGVGGAHCGAPVGQCADDVGGQALPARVRQHLEQAQAEPTPAPGDRAPENMLRNAVIIEEGSESGIVMSARLLT